MKRNYAKLARWCEALVSNGHVSSVDMMEVTDCFDTEMYSVKVSRKYTESYLQERWIEFTAYFPPEKLTKTFVTKSLLDGLNSLPAMSLQPTYSSEQQF
jgi:hypothetical protein